MYMIYDIFDNCNWVVTRWQQYSTHLHTNNTQNDTKQTIHRKTQQFWNSGSCPVLASYTLAFALQLRKKHGKTSVRVAGYSSTLSLISELDGVGGQRHAPAALPPGKTRYPLYRRLGGSQGRSGRGAENLPLLPYWDSIPRTTSP